VALCNNFSFGIDLDFSNGISVIIIMEYKVPQFAIFQNSRTRQSSIWVGQQGRWVDAQESEFEALWTLAQIIRNSKNASEVMKELVIQARKMQKSEAPPEPNWDIEPGFFIPPEELDGLDETDTPDPSK
jgi:hypothetical protein|tara:strand:- start:475 stop:861 length:387 start_codon:yes stop_codon:yes gene_type:complete